MMGGFTCPNKKRRENYHFSHWIQSVISILIGRCCFLLIGTFTIVSTNVGKTTYAPNIVPKVIVKQSVFCVCGYIAMWFMNRLFRFRWYSAEWFIVPLCLFIMVLPFAFPEIGGSHAWIQVAGISLQPSEIQNHYC